MICSHILTELQDIADEITILNYGKVVFSVNKNFGHASALTN
ncbi:hypothetical protein [Spiroplasma endosymbiont of Glossina fuscipes fuscipes]